jgi:MoaA/NifB/PqqE/SkfB family radical SAM enzyme
MSGRLHPLLGGATSQAHVNGPAGVGCYAGWFQFYGTACGDITPCDFTPLSFGNVREAPLADIWRKMTSHPAYSEHWDHCRMQDVDFRTCYIDRIPDTGPFPFPIDRRADLPAEARGGPVEARPPRPSVGIRA